MAGEFVGAGYARPSCRINSRYLRRLPEVAKYLRTTMAALAQDRYKGTAPKFIKRGSRVVYRWSDVLDWLDRNTIQRTDERRT